MAKTIDDLINSIDKLVKEISEEKNRLRRDEDSSFKRRSNKDISWEDEEAVREASKNGLGNTKIGNAISSFAEYKAWKKLAGKEGVSAGGKQTAMKNAKSAKASGVAIAAQVVSGAAEKISKMVTQAVEYEMKGQKIRLDAAKKSADIQLKLIGDVAKKSLSTGTTSLMDTLQESSFKAMNNGLEIGKNYLATGIEMAQISFDKTIDLSVNTMQQTRDMAEQIMGTVGDALSSIPNPYTAIAGAVVSVAKNIFTASTEIDIKKQELLKDAFDKMSDFKKELVDQTAGIVQQFADLAQATDKLLMEIDTQAHNASRLFGFGEGQTNDYTKYAAYLNRQMATVGKSFEDLAKMQNAYISESGRNRLMTGREGLLMSSFAKLYNISDEESAQIMGAMNIFNTSIESGSDIMFEMYKTANKMGVSNQKFAKDMQKNLKLAEKYQFKGGVEGMMKMSLWAQKTRFNMDSLASALEKMHTGNIEDVIQTSAKLNVLGGNAALMSDPMAMLFNAYADPAQYAKNMKEMVAGFGHFNTKTGETEFNINEQMRMEAMAAAMGVSKEDFFNMARQEKKAGAVKRALGGRYDEETTDLLTQHATFNRKDKKWQVNVIGKESPVDVDNLTADDLKNIVPEDTQEGILEYTKRIFSILEKNTVVDNTYKSELAERTQEAHQQAYEERRGIKTRHFEGNMDEYAGAVERNFDATTQALEDQYGIASKVFETLVDGKTLDEVFYESIHQGTIDAGTKIGFYGSALLGMINNNDAQFLEGVRGIDARLAVYFEQALDAAKDQTEYDEIVADKTVTPEEMKKILSSDIMQKKFLQDYGVARYSDSEQLRMMKEGNLILKNDQIVDATGKLFKMEESAANAKTQNKKWEIMPPSQVRGSVVERLGDWVNPIAEGFDQLWGGTEVGQWVSTALKRADFNPFKMAGNIDARDIGRGTFSSVHDLIISPKHGVYETDPEDTIVASKPGGSLDRAAQRRASTPENINLTVNGTLKLSSGNQSIDLMELLRNDPAALREITKAVIVEGSRTQFGGRPEYAPSRYTSFS